MVLPTYYKISLQIWHPFLTANEITERVGKNSHNSWSKGEQRKTPIGDFLKGVYKESYWHFSAAEGEDGRVADALRTIVDSLRDQASGLLQMRITGGKLMLHVHWYPTAATGTDFDFGLLSGMVDLGLELGVSVYLD